jgi:hypothetical protein
MSNVFCSVWRPLVVLVAFWISVTQTGVGADSPVVEALLGSREKVEQVQCLASVRCDLIVHRISRLDSPRFGLTLLIAGLKDLPSTFRMRDVRRTGPLVTLFETIAIPTDAVLVNGGFFAVDDKDAPRPTGFIVANGNRLSAFVRTQVGGVLTATGDQHRVIPARLFDPAIGYRDAVQGRPILVYNGMRGVQSDDRRLFDRVAIGVTQSGSVLVAGAFNDNGQAVSLYEFAEMLVRASKVYGLELAEAINLDGGPSAHIYLPRLRRHFGGPTTTYLPNAVAIGTK